MTVKIGLDLGSTAIKAVMTIDDRPVWSGLRPTAPGQENVAKGLIGEGLSALDLRDGDIFGIASTGYGKKLFASSDKTLDEIAANAAGIFKLSGGEARAVINIGGQDLKTIILDDSGRVIDFKMNDKCAAGTGRFFELAARILDTPLEDFGPLSEDSREEIELNSTCVVFAESEIVSLLARGVRKEDIVRALHASVARRAAGLLGARMPEGAVYIDGGPAKNGGLVSAMEEELMTEVRALGEPQFTVAYGAALVL
ncbi:2-hydroxyglutaryl-CoA dehydratase [Synergistales bacterium]|nr:2-hydroxyglutaryl-CoA dehydratase [Synergistales bacterium]GHV51871.1 2-hydroxyglutaryl-CoA dehydratase [Synergistales bacterium]